VTAQAGASAGDPLAVAASPPRDRLAAWCGWVLVGAVTITPGLLWLAPMGFALLVSLVGLFCLPAMRMDDKDRPAALILFGLLIWAAVSTTWSPFHPKNAGGSTILKLAFQLPLYWSAICGARRAEPRLKTLALRILAWGAAAIGVVLLVEAMTDGVTYQWLHEGFYSPIRHDYAEAHLGHSTFVLALLWPLAALGAGPRLRPWLVLGMLSGLGGAALAFSSDAPVIAIVLAPLVGWAVYRWPRGAPKALASAAVVLFLCAPLVVWAVRESGDYSSIQHAIPLSWSLRMGYWSHAIDWISDKPLRGWGLDASRMFSPGIVLHPHDGPLQVWLELGLVGAVAAAVFWAINLVRLASPSPSLAKAAVAGSAAVYLLFGALNFGIWQEWWLGLGALVVMLAGMLPERPRPPGVAA
jgi:O-antigen ligase